MTEEMNEEQEPVEQVETRIVERDEKGRFLKTDVNCYSYVEDFSIRRNGNEMCNTVSSWAVG